MDDFLPKGGLVSTTSTWSLGSSRRASSVRIGGSRLSSSGPMPCRNRFIAHRRATPSTSSTPRSASKRRCLFWPAVELVVAGEVVVGGEQEAAGAAGRVDDDLARLRLHAVDDRLDERARREVLPRAALDVLGVPLQQALVGVALHVGRHREPVLLADQLDDELAELGRVLDLVLGLAEDEAEHPALLAELRAACRGSAAPA